jgi:hypothetical protein
MSSGHMIGAVQFLQADDDFYREVAKIAKDAKEDRGKGVFDAKKEEKIFIGNPPFTD